MRAVGDGIIVTGRGAVSHFGVGAARLTAGARAFGQSDGNGFRAVPDVAASDYVDVKTPLVDRTESLALVATTGALAEAGWTARAFDESRVGLVLGTAYGSLSTLEEYLRTARPSPLRFLHTFMNAAAGLTCQTLRLRGAHAVLCSGRLAGLQAIRYASHLLRSGKADLMVCGGVDSLRAWQGSAAGTGLLGEGAGLLALARRGNDTSERRCAELAGSAVRPFRSPVTSSFQDALSSALKGAGASPEDLTAVVLATGPDEEGAVEERRALEGLAVPEARWVDLKSHLGDTGAAHGGLAAVVATSLLAEHGAGAFSAVQGCDRGQCVTLVFEKALDQRSTA